MDKLTENTGDGDKKTGNTRIQLSAPKEIPNETTLDAIIAAENSEGMCGPFDSVEVLMKDLDA